MQFTVHEQTEMGGTIQVDADLDDQNFVRRPSSAKKGKKKKGKKAPTSTAKKVQAPSNIREEDLRASIQASTASAIRARMSPVKQRASTAKSTGKRPANIRKTGGTIEKVAAATIEVEAPRQPADGGSPVRSNLRARISAGPPKLGTNANMFHNQDLEDKIARVQAEFNALLNEKSTSSPVRRVGDDLHMDQFYKVMGDFYDSGMKKHESPTRRLMDQ